jgi:hypothetical protein
MPMPQPIHMPTQGAMQMPATTQPAAAPIMNASPLRQHQMAPAAAVAGVAEAEAEAPPVEARTSAPHVAQHRAPPQAAPQQQASRGLFNDTPRPATVSPAAAPMAEPLRPWLSTVRNAFRRHYTAAAVPTEAAPARVDPVVRMDHRTAQPAATVQVVPNEEATLDIPAFLRRQSS